MSQTCNDLTDFERDALLTLVDGIVNDEGIDTYGLSAAEKAAINRARTKLRATQRRLEGRT